MSNPNKPNPTSKPHRDDDNRHGDEHRKAPGQQNQQDGRSGQQGSHQPNQDDKRGGQR